METDISALERFAVDQPDHEAGHPMAVRVDDTSPRQCVPTKY